MKTEKIMTRWFKERIQPVRNGIYETRFTGKTDVGYSIWHGDYWGYQFLALPDAHRCKDVLAGHQQKEWRGLASKPKATK